MTTQDRPRGYGIIDENGANTYAATELPEEANGHPPDIIVTSPKLNHSLNRHGTWARRLDQTALTVGSVLYASTQSSRLSGDPLEYDTGAGLSQAAIYDANDTYYLVHGRVVSINANSLGDQGADPKTFIATKDNHVYLKSDGTLRFDPVVIAVPASPNADEIHIGTARTNATDVTTWTAATGVASKLLVPAKTRWNFTEDSLAVNKVTDGGFGLLRFIQDDNDATGWSFQVSTAGARKLTLVEASAILIDFGESGVDMTIARAVDMEGLRVVPAGGTRHVQVRSTAPADATDETLHTLLIHVTDTYTIGAGKTVTVISGANLPSNTLINLDLIVTFVDSGSENVATYQKWHVAFKKVGGTTSEVDGGASGEHMTNRPGSGGHLATVVAWAGTALGVINLTFTAAAAGRVCVSGLVQVSRYD